MAETQTSTKKKERRAPPAPRSTPEPCPPSRPKALTRASATSAWRRARCGWWRTWSAGKQVGDALAILKYTPKAAAAKPLAKLLRSAVANAEQKGGRVDVDALVVKTAQRGPGPHDAPVHAARAGAGLPGREEDQPRYVELGTAARG